MNFEAFLSNTEKREHTHPWGKYSSFLAEFWRWKRKIRAFGSAPFGDLGYCGIRHRSYNRNPIEYGSLNIASQLTTAFPAKTSLIKVTSIVSAIIDDFRERNINVAQSSEDKRLVQVLLDQLATRETQHHFLPSIQS